MIEPAMRWCEICLTVACFHGGVRGWGIPYATLMTSELMDIGDWEV